MIGTLGVNIKKIREKKGWSINKLKLESGVGYATLHDLESGKSQNLSLVNLEKVAKALNSTTDELLNIESVEFTVCDITETVDVIFESDELELDNEKLTDIEKELLKDFFISGIENVRRKRGERK